MLSDGFVAIGGFADLWLFSDPEYKAKLKPRDLRRSVVAAYPCSVCGAPAGGLCWRRTVSGRLVERRLPHFGRGLREFV